MTFPPAAPRVLGINPCALGAGFGVLEGSERLVDAGIARVWSPSDDEFLARVEDLCDRWQPTLLAAEEAAGSPRGPRARRRIARAEHYAEGRGIAVLPVPRAAVRRLFQASGPTKHAVAAALARQFPELAPRLPRAPKPWQGQDERLHLFDAVALALTALRAWELRGGSA